MIGRTLLIHSATLTPAGAPDADGNATPGTAVNLSKVRVMMAKQNAMTALGDAKDDELIMYFDCKASLPAGTTFKADDVITFSSVNYKVRKVSTHYSVNQQPEYYKVALIGN
jgi:hypothetical protein